MRIETKLKLTDNLIFFKITSVLVLKVWYSEYCRVLFCFVEEQLFLSVGKYFFFSGSHSYYVKMYIQTFLKQVYKKKNCWKLCFFTEIEYMLHNILKTGPFLPSKRLWLWVGKLDNFSNDKF